MGVAVVPLVVAPIEGGVVEAEQTHQPGHSVVETLAAKGGAVAALVQTGKTGCQPSTAEHQSDQPQGQR